MLYWISNLYLFKIVPNSIGTKHLESFHLFYFRKIHDFNFLDFWRKRRFLEFIRFYTVWITLFLISLTSLKPYASKIGLIDAHFCQKTRDFWVENDRLFGMISFLTWFCKSYKIESCDNCHFNLSHVEIMQPSEWDLKGVVSLASWLLNSIFQFSTVTRFY